MGRLPDPPEHHEGWVAAGKPQINVLKALSYSPATVKQWSNIGGLQIKYLELSHKVREFVVLLTASKYNAVYEWTHHVPISDKVGITEAQRGEMQKAGNAKSYFSRYDWVKNEAKFDEREQVLMEFLEAVIDFGEVDDELWKSTSENFSYREIAEIISMQGFYYTFARVTTVLKVDIEKAAEKQPTKL